MSKIEKSDTQWREELTPKQYRVTREKRTVYCNRQALSPSLPNC